MRFSELISMLVDSRKRSLELLADLTDEQLKMPLLPIINPPIWEIGHVAWFQEKWVLRHLRGRPSILSQADSLWDSAAVSHDTRWDLPLLSRAETQSFAQDVLSRVIETLPPGDVAESEAYFYWLVVMHEDMHGEAFTYTRQTLGYPAPVLSVGVPRMFGCGVPSDVHGNVSLQEVTARSKPKTSWLNRTHPKLKDRIKRVERQIAKQKLEMDGRPDNFDRYQTTIKEAAGQLEATGQ